ncbi:MAG: hypothetical protein EPO11_02090 [Gammaproteobacteria bacterium]|nr:MAG: hypothetical protein EPO11_02090 [Gammaproteobacteria bacterium]
MITSYARLFQPKTISPNESYVAMIDTAIKNEMEPRNRLIQELYQRAEIACKLLSDSLEVEAEHAIENENIYVKLLLNFINGLEEYSVILKSYNLEKYVNQLTIKINSLLSTQITFDKSGSKIITIGQKLKEISASLNAFQETLNSALENYKITLIGSHYFNMLPLDSAIKSHLALSNQPIEYFYQKAIKAIETLSTGNPTGRKETTNTDAALSEINQFACVLDSYNSKFESWSLEKFIQTLKKNTDTIMSPSYLLNQPKETKMIMDHDKLKNICDLLGIAKDVLNSSQVEFSKRKFGSFMLNKHLEGERRLNASTLRCP